MSSTGESSINAINANNASFKGFDKSYNFHRNCPGLSEVSGM